MTATVLYSWVYVHEVTSPRR